jgi:Saccharopine dehydrogenase NADP binding domain
MARILVLGGAGTQGWEAARVAMNRSAADDHIILLSREQTRGREAVERLNALSGPCRVSSAVATLLDPNSFADHLQQSDIVLNAAAPFFELGSIAAKVSIDCGAHYFDICDDWEATVPILGLHSQAIAEQVAVVTGLGAAPGITSMLAMIAMRELDEVEQVVTAWPVPDGGSSPLPSNVPFIHFIQCCVGPIRLMRNGHFIDEEPLLRESIALPNGSELIGYTIGSPESVTLPIGNNNVRVSLNLALMSESTAEKLRTLAGAVREGSFSAPDASNLLNQGSAEEDEQSAHGSPQICAIAIGTKNGLRMSVQTYLSAWPEHDYSIAGTALGLAPKMLAEGVFGCSGAYSIEAVISPETYLDDLARAVSPEFQYQVKTVSGSI